MKDFEVITCRNLTDYCRTEFVFERNVLNQISDGEVIDWSIFESKTIKFVVIDQSVLDARPEIYLDGGEVDGDLIIVGSGRLKSFSAVNCAIRERIKIVNLVADNVEICSNAKAITLEKCNINNLYICGEIEDFISIDDCEIEDFEVDGLVDKVLVNGLNADLFNIGFCDFKLLKMNVVEVKDLIIPTVSKVNFNDLSVVNFEVAEERNLRRVKA